MSTVWWGESKGQAGCGALESALLYFQPREVLSCGELSVDVQRTLKAFTETQEGCSLETVAQPSASFDDAKEVWCSHTHHLVLPYTTLCCVLSALRVCKLFPAWGRIASSLSLCRDVSALCSHEMVPPTVAAAWGTVEPLIIAALVFLFLAAAPETEALRNRNLGPTAATSSGAVLHSRAEQSNSCRVSVIFYRWLVRSKTTSQLASGACRMGLSMPCWELSRTSGIWACEFGTSLACICSLCPKLAT